MNCWYLWICFLLVGFAACDGFQTSSSEKLLDGRVFDFIVIGAGTAGCVIATRLAESGRHSVLLIGEGGISHPTDFDIPALSADPALLSNPNFAKPYLSVPQSNVGLAQNGTATFLVGKTHGGGSAINQMFMNRGNTQDYNNWAKLTGDESWNYSNLLKYFRKNEDYVGINPSYQRGFGGPITVSPPGYTPGLSEIFQGGTELGYRIGDPNGPQTEGFTWVEFSQKNGRRVSSFKGYIEPLLQQFNKTSHSKRSNLLILTQTTANRIIFKGNRAVGVRFTANSTGQSVPGYVEARNEIILSAGVMDSPALLMRSGIGPKSVLEQANIPVIKNLAVGENLQEHVFLPHTIILGNRSAAFDPERELTPEAWRIFEQTGTGPYSSTSGVSGQAFITSSELTPLERFLGWPDLHLIYPNANKNATASLVGSLPEIDDLKEWEIPVAWMVILARPKSRGVVTLNSQNIEDPPVIDYKFLTHPVDMKALVYGLKIILKLCEDTETLQGIGCRISTAPLPACSHLQFRSDPYWICYIKQTTTLGLHSSGTCKMGSGPEDPQAVVDSQLRVIGVENLSIADASIMPAVINTNTQAAVYVIAEKAADMILTRWEGLKPIGDNYWNLRQNPLQI